MLQECPKTSPKKRTWYEPRRRVCIARFLLRSALQGVQRDRARDSFFPPKMLLKTYLVPGWKAPLSARHVWKMQNSGQRACIVIMRRKSGSPKSSYQAASICLNTQVESVSCVSIGVVARLIKWPPSLPPQLTNRDPLQPPPLRPQ